MSNSLQLTIERICDRLIEEKRWRPFRDREISIVRTGFPIAAYLSLHDRRIHLVFSERLGSELGALIDRHSLGISVEDATEAIVRFLFTHEYNHHHYCPGTATLFEQIIAGIREVVELRELRESRIKQVSFEIANMFSDTVINAIEAHKDQTGGYRLGQDISQLLALYYTHAGRIGVADKAMRLFLRSHLHLCGTSPGYFEHSQRYLQRPFSEEDALLRELLLVFLRDEPIVNRAYARELVEQDSRTIVDRMCDCTHWEHQARDYARLIHPLLKSEHPYLANSFTDKKEPGSDTARTVSRTGPQSAGAEASSSESPVADHAMPPQSDQSDSSDGGTERSAAPEESEATNHQEQLSEDIVPGGDANQSQAGADRESAERDSSVANQDERRPVPEEDATVLAASAPEPRQPLEIPESAPDETDAKSDGTALARRRFVRVRRPGGRFAGIGDGILRDIEPRLERLDALYRERAGRITFSDEGGSGSGLLVATGLEESDLTDLTRLHLPSSVFVRRSDDSTYLLLRERRFPVDLLAPVVPDIGEIPDICFVFDSSGSMGFDPENGTGEYHIAVLTAYSIISGLEQRGIAGLLKYNAINFSSTTFASGWHSYLELDEVKRAMFRYQGGGTTIDIRKLAMVREQRSDRYILFLLSDLEVSNIAALEQELVAMHRSRASSVVIFKLGGENISTERLQREGVTVLFPSKAEEFLYGALKIARQVYAAGGV